LISGIVLSTFIDFIVAVYSIEAIVALSEPVGVCLYSLRRIGIMQLNSDRARNFMKNDKIPNEIRDKNHIVIVDDEPDIVELVSLHLKKAGFKVSAFSDGKQFNNFINTNIPDLVILDLMLPDADGLEICKYLRSEDAFSTIPIIMLTAKGDESDKIIGLELGADDYVTKPFSPKELVARIKAVLRRRISPTETRILVAGPDIRIDIQKHQVHVRERVIDLTPTEFKILTLLVSKKGWVFTRDRILDHLWGEDKYVLDRTIDVHIKHLRDKLGNAGSLIKNIRGVGYKLEE